MASEIAHIVDLPVEIFYIILSYVDGVSFQRCKQVCHKFKEIVNGMERDPKLWLKINEKEHKHTFKLFDNHSELSPFQIYQNIKLWDKVSHAKFSQKVILEGKDVTIVPSCCVFKDHMTVCTSGGLQYIDLREAQVSDTIKEPIIHCEENEYFVMLLVVDRDLELIGKINEDGVDSNDHFIRFSPVNFCLQYENKCYAIMKFNHEMWCFTWENSTWKKEFVATYHNREPISCLEMHDNEVYLITKRQTIWKPNPDEGFTCVKNPGYFEESVHHFSPYNVLKRVFNRFFSNNSFFNSMYCDDTDIGGNSQCCKEYGDIIITGGFECELNIYDRRRMAHPKPTPELTINLLPFLNTDDAVILSIDVRELEQRHEIYACMASNSTNIFKVVRITLEYSDSVITQFLTQNCFLL